MKDKQFLVECADLVKQKMPEGYNFVVFAFPQKSGERMLYVSDATRESAIEALYQWLEAQNNNPDIWMKHK